MIDTPVGRVSAELGSDGTVTFANVPAYVHATDVHVLVPGHGTITGDIAWGGNWFFITHTEFLTVSMENLAELMTLTQSIQDALNSHGITGANGEAIDHIEISAAPARPDADSRNFVLCSGGEYDRSPCGTGTSATMAARHAHGQLAIGAEWRQEGIAGGIFTGWLSEGEDGALVPHVRGRAWVTGEATLHLAADDPFRFGITAADAGTSG